MIRSIALWRMFHVQCFVRSMFQVAAAERDWTAQQLGGAESYGDVESKERFPHLHSPDYDG